MSCNNLPFHNSYKPAKLSNFGDDIVKEPSCIIQHKNAFTFSKSFLMCGSNLQRFDSQDRNKRLFKENVIIVIYRRSSKSSKRANTKSLKSGLINF